jgi:hypothetical protein
MFSLDEIEAVIIQLPKTDVEKLANWLQDYLNNDNWDRQIEADAKSGRLDKLIQRSKADIAADLVKPLDEILNNS